MKIFYCRCSTDHQNLDRQLEDAKKVGAEKIFQEKISGKNTDRKQLQEMLDYVRENDVVYVSEYSRLARSTSDLISIVEKLKEKGCDFCSLKENVDTSTPTGKLIFTIFAGLAQFERESILEKQRIGIELAKQKGVYKGRKPKTLPENAEEIIADWKAKKISGVEAQKRLNVSAPTFYRIVNEK